MAPLRARATSWLNMGCLARRSTGDQMRQQSRIRRRGVDAAERGKAKAEEVVRSEGPWPGGQRPAALASGAW